MFNFWKACFPLFRKNTDDREQYTLLSQKPIDNDADTTTAKNQKHIRFAGEYPRPTSPSLEVKERHMGFGIGGAGNMRKSVFYSPFRKCNLTCICILYV